MASRKRRPQAEFSDEALDALIGDTKTPEELEALFRCMKKALAERILDAEPPERLPCADGSRGPRGTPRLRDRGVGYLVSDDRAHRAVETRSAALDRGAHALRTVIRRALHPRGVTPWPTTSHTKICTRPFVFAVCAGWHSRGLAPALFGSRVVRHLRCPALALFGTCVVRRLRCSALALFGARVLRHLRRSVVSSPFNPP